MSRTRAERRHNTRKKAARLQKLADAFCICDGNVTPGGERTSCPRCYLENRIYPWNSIEHFHLERARLNAFMLAQS